MKPVVMLASRLIVGVLLVVVHVAPAAAAAAEQPSSLSSLDLASPNLKHLENAAPERVLFVGNSYLYYNDSVHNHVRRLVADILPDQTTRFKSATIGGARLSHHDLNNLLTPGKLGIKSPFELVILQGGSSETLTAEAAAQFHGDVDRMVKQIRQSGAEPALYMTHAYVDPHPKVDPAMFAKIYRHYLAAGNRNTALVIPVGLAFERSYAARPELELHEFFDGTHPSVQGSYLAACVVMASIYSVSPVGASYRAYGEISADDADFLQHIAQQTVEEFYGS